MDCPTADRSLRPGDLAGSKPERLEEAFAQDGAGMHGLGSGHGASNIGLGRKWANAHRLWPYIRECHWIEGHSEIFCLPIVFPIAISGKILAPRLLSH
jgi:hypothetical protein